MEKPERGPAASALDHATREAARAYADQTLSGWRAVYPLLVRDEPADALYQRSPTILAEQIEHVDIEVLENTEKEEIAARSYHERFVALAGAMSFQRRTGETDDVLIAALVGRSRKPSPLADSMVIQRRLCSWTSAAEHEVWMAIEMARVGRFLDRNWIAICQLAEAAVNAKLDSDGWRVLSAGRVEAILHRRPVKLSSDERSRLESRATGEALAIGRAVARKLELGST